MVVEVIVIVALAIGLALGIQAFLVKPYQIPSVSMEPTLVEGQRVLVNRAFTRLGDDPDVGDVIVFHPPKGATANKCGDPDKKPGEACPLPPPEMDDTNFIKRVVAGPGDELSIENGMPIVNGEQLEGDWEIKPCRGAGGCDFPVPITIPEDHYFMMGDNRGESDDSRFWGPVPRDWIIGKAFVTYWPPDRIGTL
jgi:signal peptidase I